MNEIQKTNIENLIYEIRGKQVMFASDVAKLYNEETRRINEVVKRNINRFPEDFCFQLTKEENNLYASRSQNAILNKSNNKRGSNTKYLPYVFTEHGIMMLSGLLKNNIAAEVNKAIIKAFVEMRKYLSTNLIEQKYYNDMIVRHDTEIKLLQETFNKLENNIKINEIFFEGQIYDAYSLLLDIFNSAKKYIIIIDNYIDKTILDLLAKTKKEILIITSKYNKLDLTRYKEQYNNIKLKINNNFHDRFLIIDNKTLYHSGASFKDLGKKCFAINKIEDKEYLDKILNKI